MTPDWFDEDDPAEVARERKREPDPSSSSYACCKSALLSHVETDVLEIGRGKSPPPLLTLVSLSTLTPRVVWGLCIALHNGGSSASAAVLDAGDDATGSGALDDALDDGGINGGGADDGGGGD